MGERSPTEPPAMVRVVFLGCILMAAASPVCLLLGATVYPWFQSNPEQVMENFTGSSEVVLLLLGFAALLLVFGLIRSKLPRID